MADYRIRIAVDPSGAVAGSRTAEVAVTRIGAAADKAKLRAGGLMGMIRGLGGALAVASIVAGIATYMKLVDTMKQANAQIRLAAQNQAAWTAGMTDSFNTAQRQGVAIGGVSTFMSKAMRAANGMGLAAAAAERKAADATAAVSAGARASGTDARHQAAGLQQLAIGLSAGRLQGQHLKAVLEDIPMVGVAIANAMGIKGGTGAIREMGKQGKLTSQFLLEGLAKARPALEKMANMIPLTFGAALQKVKNSAANLTFGFDRQSGLGAGIIKALDLLSRAMDTLALHASAVGTVIRSVMLVAGARSVIAFSASARAAKLDATAKMENLLATRALAVEESRLAAAELARLSKTVVRRASTGALAEGGNAVLAASHAKALTAATSAAKGLAVVEAEVVAGEVAMASSTGLIGSAFNKMSAVATAAIEKIGGGIGLIVVALVALGVWAAKSALGFKPIANEAGTVGDYVAVAFSDATAWAGKKFSEFSVWAGKKLQDIMTYLRPVAVYIVDAFLQAARYAAGAVEGIVAAWRAGVSNISAILAGLGKDVGTAMTGGGISGANTMAAVNSAVNIGSAARAGFNKGFGGTFAGVTGESVITAGTKFVQSIPDRISDFAKRSGWRDRANARANARNKAAAETGGTMEQPAPEADKKHKEKKKKEKKEKDERTFADILKDANEEAKLAGMVTNEREKESAVLAAQKELKRSLLPLERAQLAAAIQLKQTNAANLALSEKTRDVMQDVAKARVTAAAEAATVNHNPAMAIALEAENAVQEQLNQAKRDGVVLDASKVEAYRQAVQLAAIETQQVKAQTAAKAALKEIADNARKAIQSAVSDAIYAGLSGDIKGVKGLFQAVGSVLKRAMAEQITMSLFGNANKVDQTGVTKAAVDIATPAARAVVQGAYHIVDAMNKAATTIKPGGTSIDPLAPLAAGVDGVASTLTGGAAAVQTGITAVTSVFQNGAGGIGGAISGIIGSLSHLLGIGGTSGGPNGAPIFKLSASMEKLVGTLAKGAMFGQIGAQLGKSIFGGKGSATGGAIGGALGQLGGQIVGKAMGSMLGKTLGSAMGPLGGIVGGMIGSAVFGALFKKKAKTGFVTVSSTGVGDASGTDSAMKKSAGVAGNAIIDKLKAIAKQLGAGVGDFGKITVGQSDGKWRVNTTGSSLKTKRGAQDFGSDGEAALAYAVEQAIKKGAFTGLTQGVSDAIKSGRASVEEAVSFIADKKKIDRQAMALVDPIAAAVADVDDEYKTMLDQYKLFGENTTNLEKVYLDARKKAIETGLQDQLSGVKGLMAEIKGGTVGGASVSDRVSEQSRLFSALEATQKAGGPVNYEQVNTVGRALLDATRELEGSTPEFYAQVNRVMAVLEDAIASGNNPTVSVLPTPLDFGNAIAPPIVTGLVAVEAAINTGFGNLLTGLNNQSQAIVRGDAATVGAVDGLNRNIGGSGGMGRNEGNYDLRSF